MGNSNHRRVINRAVGDPDDPFVLSSDIEQSDEPPVPKRRRRAMIESDEDESPTSPPAGQAMATELARMVVTCKTYGQHFGGSKTVGLGIGPHSDHAAPLAEMVAALSTGDAPPLQYQVAHYHVSDLSQCTQTLYVLDLKIGRHEELSISLYRAWLEWLAWQDGAADLDRVLAQGGKQEWPGWALESFEPFRLEHGARHPAEGNKLIVLRTPPPDMFPEFESGWVTMRWLQGSLHAGFNVPKRGRGEPDRYRTVMFYTEADSSGRYMSDVKARHQRPFIELFDKLRWELDAVIRNTESASAAAAELKALTPELERRYPLTCMDGPSHARFVGRVVLVVRSQPSREQMLATLWHTGALEMNLSQDLRELVARREELTRRAADQMGSLRYTTVSSTDADTSDVMGRVLAATHALQMTRLHNYLDATSEETFQPAEDLATLYSPQRKEFRKGPHRGRGNISDSCWRCTEAGFGIFGAIFVFPHDIIVRELDEGAPGEQ
jgi:hypothetical protein